MNDEFDVYGLPQAPPIGATATAPAPASANGAGPAPAEPKRARRTNMAMVQIERVQWWWKPRIARGKVTLLVGDPGCGKSYVTNALMAVNSFWGGLTPEGGQPADAAPAKTLLLQVEDDLNDTTAPRLDKLGAHRAEIETFGLSDVFTLNPDGLAELERHMEELRPTLVVIDPATFFIGSKVDMNRANEVREPLAVLGRIAQRYDAAIVLVMHLNKGQAKSLYRVLGSIDFTAAVRSILLAGRIEGQPDRGRALFHIKVNTGREAPPIGYDIVEDDADDDVGYFTWLAETDLTLAEIEGRQVGRPAAKAREVQAWLRATLANGPLDAREVHRLATEADIPETTLKRVARYSVVKEQVDARTWTWSNVPLPFADDMTPLGDSGGSDGVS